MEKGKHGRWDNKETSESGKRKGQRLRRSGQMGEIGMTKENEKKKRGKKLRLGARKDEISTLSGSREVC